MQKVDTVIVNTKQRLITTVNEILKEGVPMSMLDIMWELIGNEIKAKLEKQLEYEKQTPEQVEWAEPMNESQVSE